MELTDEAILANRVKGVALLRENKLPQITGYFYRNGCYCALGVLAKAAGIDVENVLDPWDEVAEAYGIYYDDGADSESEIYEMNDERGKSFPEIGNYLARVWGIG